MNTPTTLYQPAKNQLVMQYVAIVLLIVALLVIFTLLVHFDVFSTFYVSQSCAATSYDHGVQFLSSSAVPSCWMLR